MQARVLVLATVVALSGASTARADEDRAGPPAATQAPNGVPLAPDDPHRLPGEPLARPILAGPFADRSKPALLYLHGGGFVLTGRKQLEANRPTIRRWARAGVAVWGADYRRDRLSLPDAVDAYRALRAKVGASRRICVLGESSGGALAILLAARFSRIACVVTYAGVSDLRRLPDGPLADEVRNWLLPFGGLRRWDPLTNASGVRQPVLLVHHLADKIVPIAQSTRLQPAIEDARLIKFREASAGIRTTHGDLTSARAWDHAHAAAVRLVRPRPATAAQRARRAP